MNDTHKFKLLTPPCYSCLCTNTQTTTGTATPIRMYTITSRTEGPSRWELGAAAAGAEGPSRWELGAAAAGAEERAGAVGAGP